MRSRYFYTFGRGLVRNEQTTRGMSSLKSTGRQAWVRKASTVLLSSSSGACCSSSSLPMTSPLASSATSSTWSPCTAFTVSQRQYCSSSSSSGGGGGGEVLEIVVESIPDSASARSGTTTPTTSSSSSGATTPGDNSSYLSYYSTNSPGSSSSTTSTGSKSGGEALQHNVVGILDQFALSRVGNCLKRLHPDDDVPKAVTTQLGGDGAGTTTEGKTSSRLGASFHHYRHQGATMKFYESVLTFIGPGSTEYVAVGFANTEKDAEVACAMHAERILDNLGIPVFQLSSKQTKHALAARAQGRYAPMPGEPPRAINDVEMVPPLWYFPGGSYQKHQHSPEQQQFQAADAASKGHIPAAPPMPDRIPRAMASFATFQPAHTPSQTTNASSVPAPPPTPPQVDYEIRPDGVITNSAGAYVGSGTLKSSIEETSGGEATGTTGWGGEAPSWPLKPPEVEVKKSPIPEMPRSIPKAPPKAPKAPPPPPPPAASGKAKKEKATAVPVPSKPPVASSVASGAPTAGGSGTTPPTPQQRRKPMGSVSTAARPRADQLRQPNAHFSIVLPSNKPKVYGKYLREGKDETEEGKWEMVELSAGSPMEMDNCDQAANDRGGSGEADSSVTSHSLAEDRTLSKFSRHTPRPKQIRPKRGVAQYYHTDNTLLCPCLICFDSLDRADKWWSHTRPELVDSAVVDPVTMELNEGAIFRQVLSIETVQEYSYNYFVATVEIPGHEGKFAKAKAGTEELSIHLAAMHFEVMCDALGVALFPSDAKLQEIHADECLCVGRWAPSTVNPSDPSSIPPEGTKLPLPLKGWIGSDEVAIRGKLRGTRRGPFSQDEMYINFHRALHLTFEASLDVFTPAPPLFDEGSYGLEAAAKIAREVEEKAAGIVDTNTSNKEQDEAKTESSADEATASDLGFDDAIYLMRMWFRNRKDKKELFFYTMDWQSQFKSALALPVDLGRYGLRGACAEAATVEDAKRMCAEHALDVLCTIHVKVFEDEEKQNKFIAYRKARGLISGDEPHCGPRATSPPRYRQIQNDRNPPRLFPPHSDIEGVNVSSIEDLYPMEVDGMNAGTLRVSALGELWQSVFGVEGLLVPQIHVLQGPQQRGASYGHKSATYGPDCFTFWMRSDSSKVGKNGEEVYTHYPGAEQYLEDEILQGFERTDQPLAMGRCTGKKGAEKAMWAHFYAQLVVLAKMPSIAPSLMATTSTNHLLQSGSTRATAWVPQWFGRGRTLKQRSERCRATLERLQVTGMLPPAVLDPLGHGMIPGSWGVTTQSNANKMMKQAKGPGGRSPHQTESGGWGGGGQQQQQQRPATGIGKRFDRLGS